MSIMAKMKSLLPLVVWILLDLTYIAAQGGGVGFGIRREIFFLNLEDGYFGCQVNQSTEVLQLYELSRLCDGVHDCYLGSDELKKELKCTSDCVSSDGTRCQNGACLDSLCHCNDGFGGCSCEVPDENECKYRPCDVFAHCTNSLGSFHCSCFPGYTGDGFHCQDINECDNPALASRCVANAECCNLPAHFLCKCRPGYEGDGEVQCTDINECAHPSACGANALCQNYPGNYTCSCQPGFTGNPFEGCIDIDECQYASTHPVCGSGARCTNFPGGYHCECPPGYHGDAFTTGCVDADECINRPCGKDALCSNVDGSYTCTCPPGFIGDPFKLCSAIGCSDHYECPGDQACLSNQCQNPCLVSNPCQDQECQVQDHQPVCLKVCHCQKNSDCGFNEICDGCNCNPQYITPAPIPGCEHCPPGISCDPSTGACAKAPGTGKMPRPCQVDLECLDSEACYNGQCEDLCAIASLCAPSAKCHVVKHRPVCTCPQGYEGNPATKCYLPHPLGCLSNEECSSDEACINSQCQKPCAIHNPCAPNAKCIDKNHATECSCIEGFMGNGFVSCLPVGSQKSPCQYNEDCPPDRLCDRLNRICINPCSEDSCGEHAICLPKNHGVDCQCESGHQGNPYIACLSVTGCSSDTECNEHEACLNGKCSNPCRCGPNAVCDVAHHKATCKCLSGYTGNPSKGCLPPSNPCQPNPCGYHALCEVDNGSPICFCPKGMTGNPFKSCIPEGDECSPNPCGPYTGCRVVSGSAVCFCLPEYVGDPPSIPCKLPANPCQNSPCGPNTQCQLLENGFAQCTCLPGYVESPNTIRGCVERRQPCEPNVCGGGAVCDPNRAPYCFCPEGTVGNPFKHCGEPIKSLCMPGPCGPNSDCYVTGSTEQCFCKAGFLGDPYTGCTQIPSSPCYPNPCGNYAVCQITPEGSAHCRCPDGMAGDAHKGCSGPQCTTDDQCPTSEACIGFKCRDPCPGSCGFAASCKVEKHHPVCTCNHGLTGNPLIRCSPVQALEPYNPCHPSPCGHNTICSVVGGRPVCSCQDHFYGEPKRGCRVECMTNGECSGHQACVDYKCKDPCSLSNVCGLGAVCSCKNHAPTCHCREGFVGDPFIQCTPQPYLPPYPTQNDSLACKPNPCDPYSTCALYSPHVAMCDPCHGPEAPWLPHCRPECLCNSDCPFNMACLGQKCRNPCEGTCGVGALCTVVHHTGACYCPEGTVGNPYEHCATPLAPRPPVNPCDSVYCGSNAVCKHTTGIVTCECKPDYYGNPGLGCRPECVLNTDCPNTKACVNNRCGNPCRSACGVGAMCSVVNHQPVCFCPQDTSGDPFLTCYPYSPPALPPVADLPANPCDPNPCGPYSKCLISSSGYAVCSCLDGYRGSPPACKPECVISAECAQTQACVNWKCAEVCNGICAVGATCLVINHNPICQCPPGHVGDPFLSCYLPPAIEQPKIPYNPCSPDLCGPNSLCKIVRQHPVCSCKENYIGNPPYCRPECVVNQECPGNQACIKEKCQDPCPGLCGVNAKCTVVNHTPLCTCLNGYQGDAFVGCSPIVITVPPEQPRDPCSPSPCGVNAQCSSVGGVARCSCIPPYQGNPYIGGCRPECSMNSDCAPGLACISSHCRDPCPNVCGINAECTVINHVPTCSCILGYIGDPFSSCRPEPPKPLTPINPCDPSPCGPNSRCTLSSAGAVCSCLPGFIGSPPGCRPQCVVSAECAPNQACVQQRCADACLGVCGLHARCTVNNHNPICSCPGNLVGDPFVRCYEETPRIPDVPENPCLPSPCGPNADCRVLDHHPVCSCVVGMLGAPPHCRPECLLHADCPNRLACLNNKCKDPCIGTCGFNAQCAVVNHQPQCSCQDGYQGDPFTGCSPVPVVSYQPPEPLSPCQSYPCGPNAICRERHGVGSCVCLPEYFGDPYTGCRPECVMNSDCPRTRACVNNKCVDPCVQTCGIHAECKVVHHIPNCFCPPGFTGNPLSSCYAEPTCHVDLQVDLMKRHPCMKSPCGPYSQCRAINEQAICSCLPGYYGSPPRCRPECIVSSDCNHDKSCINHICTNPCLDHLCAYNALCKVINHSPQCSCLSGYTGDPFVRCVPIQHEPAVVVVENRNPCVPSPCGPNSVCRVNGHTPICSCQSNYIGRPPHCRPECTINAECAGNLACINERCKDPCPGSCGYHAVCAVVSHSPVCSCQQGYSGDPFIGCSPYVEVVPTEGPRDPCVPNPCGANALCRERNGAGSCVCLPEYFGDPYTGCRPECVINSDCDRSKACVNNKCRDPCIGTCGINAECRVINHAPTCSCFPGYTGDPLSSCILVPPTQASPPSNPCQPSPCGPYSVCRESNGHAVCSCQTGYIGAPPACKPECMVSSECAQDKACVNQKCVDPCVGVCGVNARCQVINHNPICSCTAGFTGDPFVRCLAQPPAPSEPRPSGNPCLPSPCGPNSICRVIGNTPACSCVENYIGRPPNCRPECTINAECAGNLACINERCKDPCPGSCGAHASCAVVNHTPRCTCDPGFTGDPFSLCFFIQETPVITPTEGPRDPCVSQ
uniref:Neurogenic locus Notch protein n=1 Tax=Cacopsylla melanoneura TaxID=428564 RepID=A0A8D8VM32_9HEMI